MIRNRDPGDESDAPLKALEATLRHVLREVDTEMRERILSRGWPVWLAHYYGDLRHD